jgi:hypothetical protein
MTDWTKPVYPEAPVIWLADYFPMWDAIAALPCLADSPTALRALKLQHVKHVSLDEAQLINDKFPGQTYLGERIAKQWEWIGGALPLIATPQHWTDDEPIGGLNIVYPVGTESKVATVSDADRMWNLLVQAATS